MTRSRAIGAGVLFGLTSVVAAAGVAVFVLGRSAPFPRDAWAFRGFQLVVAVVFSAVGAVMTRNKPDNPIGWIFGGAGLAAVMQFFTEQYALYALDVRHGAIPGGIMAAWIQSWIWLAYVGGTSVYTFLLFPNGRTRSALWRIVARIAPVVLAYSAALLSIVPGPLTGALTNVRNPFGAAFLGPLKEAFSLVVLPTFAVILLSVVSLVGGFRRSTGIERQQHKWLAFSGAILAAALPFSGSVPKSGHIHWQAIVVIVAMTGIPISVGIAILRYRLYDIDRIISRTVSYALVTAVLGGVFVLIALAPTTLLGGGHTPSWLIATATLVVAALFRPVRRRVQTGVDRRFNRARYDAERTIDGFAAHLREATDITALGGELQAIVNQTMQPEHISLWLRA